MRLGGRRRAVLEEGLLVAIDKHLVVLVGDQPKQWTFELIIPGVTITVDTDVGRAIVEPIERVADSVIYACLSAGKTANVHERERFTHEAPPLSVCLKSPCGRPNSQ